MRIIPRSSVLRHFQNGTQPIDCNRARNDYLRVPLWLNFRLHLVCRLAGLPDRATAALGIGATNVLRIGGKGAAVAVLIFDVLKVCCRLGCLTMRWASALLAGIDHNRRPVWDTFGRYSSALKVERRCHRQRRNCADWLGLNRRAGTRVATTVLLSGCTRRSRRYRQCVDPLFYVWWFNPQFTFPVSMLSLLNSASSPADNIRRPVASSGPEDLDQVKKNAKRRPGDFVVG